MKKFFEKLKELATKIVEKAKETWGKFKDWYRNRAVVRRFRRQLLQPLSSAAMSLALARCTCHLIFRRLPNGTTIRQART